MFIRRALHLQKSIVGNFSHTFEAEHQGLGLWTSVVSSHNKYVASFKSTKVVPDPGLMNSTHERLLASTGGGVASRELAKELSDVSFESLASRMKALRNAKLATNTATGLQLYEIPTLVLSGAAISTAVQRTLNEEHVKKLMVRAFRPLPLHLVFIDELVFQVSLRFHFEWIDVKVCCELNLCTLFT